MYHPEDLEPDAPLDPGRLTAEERAVLDKLVEARNLYIHLPVQHPLHQQEFTRSLHELQRLIMARPTSRVEGWVKDDQRDEFQATRVFTHSLPTGIDKEGNVLVDQDEVEKVVEEKY